MINRLLIRIKTLQILYNYYRVEGMSINGAIGTLRKALDDSYRLYLYLCGLPLNVAQVAESRINREQEKFIKDHEMIRILRHLSDNKLVNIIQNDETFVCLYEDTCKALSTRALEDYMPILTAKAVSFIKNLDNDLDWDNLSEIRKMWRAFLGEHVIANHTFTVLIEEASTYLNDDISIVHTFVTKVINATASKKSFSSLLKPPYSSQEDESFGPILIEQAITHGEEYRELISKYFKDWDKDRVSEIDYIIMQLALTEAIQFPTIATRVTINEYLNLAHHYSAENSYTFINGILHELFSDLKKQGRILGD